MKRKGFTLIELLIVIAIVGILAAMMTLSSSNATAAAKAANIATSFRVIGSAFNVYKGLSGDSGSATDFNLVSKSYVGPQVKDLNSFKVAKGSNGHFYVAYKISGDTALQGRLKALSKDMGMVLSGSKGSHLSLQVY